MPRGRLMPWSASCSLHSTGLVPWQILELLLRQSLQLLPQQSLQLQEPAGLPPHRSPQSLDS